MTLIHHAWTDEELLGRSREPIAAPVASLRTNFVLLDRDGTLDRLRPGYVSDPDDLGVLHGAVDVVRQLNECGAKVVVVTNQRGIATGALSEHQLVAVHRRLVAEFAAGGAHFDGFHVCPHEEGTCDCRKPRPGLIIQALSRAAWSRTSQTVMVGDSDRDSGAAQAAGVPFLGLDDPKVGLVQKVQKLLALCTHE